MKDIRVVVDTNVLVSGLFGIKNSPSSKILQAYRNQKIILVTSPVIIEEVSDVINRERITKLTKMNEKEQKEFIEGLIKRSDVALGKQLTKIISRDLRDDKFLACGVEGKADFIITGDSDLLDLKEFKGIKILTPRKFIELVGL